jgi:hypothetical protein
MPGEAYPPLPVGEMKVASVIISPPGEARWP